MPEEDTNYQSLLPTENIEEASFISRKGEHYWILRHPLKNIYIRLNEEEYQVWKEIKEESTQFFSIPASQILQPSESDHHNHQLLKLLQHEEFLHLGRNGDPHSGNKDLDESWLSHFWELCIPLPGMHILFDTLYSKIGWILRSRWFPRIFAILCLSGLTYFLITEPLPSYPILGGGDSQLITILSIYLILITAAVLHVFGHALACKTYGRSIGDAGLLLYYGMPCLYIDTSDIWMADRKSRVIVSLAGPAVNLLIGAVCALLVLVISDSDVSTLLWRVAFLSFAVALMNLNPLLEFDGYYALADLLEVPDLRERSFSFLRSIGSGYRYIKKEGWFFFIFGISSAIFTLAIAFIGIYFWKEHMTDLLNELGKDRWEMDHILATLAIVIVFIPFFAGMIVSSIQILLQKFRNFKKKGEIRIYKREQVHEKRILNHRISK